MPDQTLWDRQAGVVDPDAAERLSRMVTGNDALVAEPGLVQALYQNNASPQQAQAINQFMAGLNAEKKVRTAQASNSKVRLSTNETTALDAMGVDYKPVLYTYQDAVTSLKEQMAKSGMQPVLDDNGKIRFDAEGNPLAEKIPQPQHDSGGSGFFGSIGHFFSSVGSDVLHGLTKAGNFTLTALDKGTRSFLYSVEHPIDSIESGDKLHQNVDPTNREDMIAQGYDPDSRVSTLAFWASGGAHSDLSDLNEKYGADKVGRALTFLNDPEKYTKSILDDTTLSSDQLKTKWDEVNSPEFVALAQQINARTATPGNDLANSLGIDPIHHAGLHTSVSLGTDLAVSFAADPTVVGLSLLGKYQRSTVAIKSLTDGAGISKILLPEEGAHLSMFQGRAISNLQDMVSHTNAMRAAIDSGDAAKQAQIMGRINANPFGGLLGDFLGTDRIIGTKSAEELASLKKGDLPFVTGAGEPITTYDDAVTYLASKSALTRLTNGFAPIESTVMPGALSSRTYLKIKGSLGAWSAGRTYARTEAGALKIADALKGDPGRVRAMLDDGALLHTLPGEDDAVDVLTGKVLAAQSALRAAKTEEDAAAATTELASARRGLASAIAKSDAALVVDDTLRGVVQGNLRRYGRAVEPSTTLGKAASIYTLGAVRRAGVIVTRLTNWLPRTTYVRLDQSADSDTIRKIARTYLTSGDSNMLAVRWSLGDMETRKTIVQGLQDQIAHAAGLTRTQAGREMVDGWHTAYENQRYLLTDEGFTDANGVLVGMYPGQMRNVFNLPNFGGVQKAAARVGLYEATMGRLFTGAGRIPSALEKLMIQWKLGALLTPTTAARANLESWLNAAADNGFSFMDALRSKALLREHGLLDGALVRRSAPMDKLLKLAPLRQAGHIYRHLLLRNMDDAEAGAIINMADDLRDSYIADQAAFHQSMQLDPGGVEDMTAAAEAGFKAGASRYRDGQVLGEGHHRNGFEITDEVDAANGAGLYAFNLALRVNKSPNLAKEIIRYIDEPNDENLNRVIGELEGSPLMRQSLFGKTVRVGDRQQKALSAAEVEQGKRQWANMLINDFHGLTTGRNGVFQRKIADYIIEHGEAPSDEWLLANVKKLNRPAALLKPIIQAVPDRPGVDGLVQQILDKEGKGYQWLVERLIQRHSTSPLFHASYAKERVALEDFKQGLIRDAGIPEEAAERAAQTMAAQRGWERIARMVDDPHMRSQMDVVGRSFFAFSRATTMMLRRWGSTFWRNPQQARRLQLAAEGAIHSGLVYSDPTTGDWMFHFPGSGVAQEVLMHAMSNIPGLRDAFLFPAADFTGRVNSIVPGSSNPFQYSTNPIVSIAGRTIADLFPSHRELFDEVDRRLNGDQGQGQGFFATLVPNLYKKLADTDILPLLPGEDDNRNALIASATVGSIYNLYAAGDTPGDNASPQEIDTWIGRVQTGIKSQLFLRAVFGAFSPATITEPGAAGLPADYAFAVQGAQGLRDEFKIVLDQTDGDFSRALAVWTAIHPDLPVYTQSGSEATTSHAILPATQSALNWMNDNLDFIGKYKSVAAFFVPDQSTGEPYSQAAFRAQMEEGLRQRKTPQEFLTGVYYATAASQYYPMYDKYQSDLAAAKAAGDTDLVRQREVDWAVWSKNFKAKHLTFATKSEASAENIANAQGQFADLQTMVKNGDVPNGLAPAVSGMVQAYRGYEQFIREHPGQTNEATASRSAALGMLQDYMNAAVKAEPSLTDLYSGVFRPLSGYNLTNEGA